MPVSELQYAWLVQSEDLQEPLEVVALCVVTLVYGGECEGF